MIVYKFGGASIATPERLISLVPIIKEATTPTLMVVSALGKTTNALELITTAAFKGNLEEAELLIATLEKQHIDYTQQVLDQQYLKDCNAYFNEVFTEMRWTVADAHQRPFDYSYDQIVSIGELLSTKICSLYLNQIGIKNQWIDARDLLVTDGSYRAAKVDVVHSEINVNKVIGTALNTFNLIITQGFIGATTDNHTVTLGREGSDYSAALFASMLNAQSLTIWKDVEGLLNADPKLFPDALKIEEISYHEVIEMAYYGAQVIHPKTIKPLQNKNIPLYVKCFLNKDLIGTKIKNGDDTISYPPLIILKKDQTLYQFTTVDFSFITEENLSQLYAVFSELNIRINLLQSSAISFVACVDKNSEMLPMLLLRLDKYFKILRNENLSLLTIRHYNERTYQKLTAGKEVLLEQRSRNTVQVVLR